MRDNYIWGFDEECQAGSADSIAECKRLAKKRDARFDKDMPLLIFIREKKVVNIQKDCIKPVVDTFLESIEDNILDECECNEESPEWYSNLKDNAIKLFNTDLLSFTESKLKELGIYPRTMEVYADAKEYEI